MTGLEILAAWVLPSLSVCFSSLMFTASIPQVYRARIQNRADAYNPLVYVAAYGHSLAWLVWSMCIETPNYFVMFNMVYGGLISLWGIFTCYRLCTSAKLRVITEGVFLLINFLCFVYYHVSDIITNPDARQIFLGIMANLHSISYYAAPLVMMLKIIREKNSIYLSLPLSIAQGFNNSFWIAWGMTIPSVLFWLPCLIGLILNIIQWFLAWKYPRIKETGGVNLKGENSLNHHQGKRYTDVDLQANFGTFENVNLHCNHHTSTNSRDDSSFDHVGKYHATVAGLSRNKIINHEDADITIVQVNDMQLNDCDIDCSIDDGDITLQT